MHRRSRDRRFSVGLIGILILTTILSAMPLPVAADDRPARLDPHISAAAASSGGTVRAILLGGDANRVAAATRDSGGRVVRNLSKAQGLAVEVPTAAISQLSKVQGVRRIAFDPPVVSLDNKEKKWDFDPKRLATQYPWALSAPQLWKDDSDNDDDEHGNDAITGRGVGVAVIDTGITASADFAADGRNRVVASAKFGDASDSVTDSHGHGTAVAGVIGGDGSLSDGKYVGVAPGVNLIDLKIGDDNGARVSDVIAALFWAVEHKRDYNIRVITMALRAAVAESYKTSLLDMAVEYAWFNGIVVVVASGNTGPGGIVYPPANDPYVITVGATDDKGTKETKDDVLADFSGYGLTQDGHAKPDFVAPGRHIITKLSNKDNTLAKQVLPERLVGEHYITLSGTSFSAAAVSGAVALLLQERPRVNPDQVKWLLRKTSDQLREPSSSSTVLAGTEGGYPNARRAVSYDGQVKQGNRGLVPNNFIAQAIANALFEGVSWDNINWDGVSWDGVSWDGVSWDGVSWDGVSWDGVSWDGVSWDGVSWDGVSWDALLRD